jgi:hypothetical protein
MNLKVGDKVRIKENTDLYGDPQYLGVGTVRTVTMANIEYPLLVDWVQENGGKYSNSFGEVELSKVNYIKKHKFI